MRKILLVMVVLVLPLTTTKAQDKPAQAPIIAYEDNKIYAVSPEDGSVRLLAAPSLPTQSLSQLRDGNVSPDSQQLVYTVDSSSDTPQEQYKSDLFVVTIADGKAEKITPGGGIFDAPAAKDQVIQIFLPTWSYDGRRIYYYRGQYVRRGNYADFTFIQLAYYDVATHKHSLVGRIDPKLSVEDLQAVRSGIVTRLYRPGFDNPASNMLYMSNNQAMKSVEVERAFLHPIIREDGDAYAMLNDIGDIDRLIDAATGEASTAGAGYYPAAQSRIDGKNSMHIFSLQQAVLTYYVYGHDAMAVGTSIDGSFGLLFGIAPDGQQLAYLRFADGPHTPIRILDMKGNTRELDFKAEQIIWGAIDYVAFPAPG